MNILKHDDRNEAALTENVMPGETLYPPIFCSFCVTGDNYGLRQITGYRNRAVAIMFRMSRWT